MTSAFRQNPSIVIVGFGNQGQAWAQNLRDSGWAVSIWAREGRGRSLAQSMGFPTAADLKQATLCALLLPDHVMGDFYRDHLANIERPITCVFAHGYAMAYGGFRLSKQHRAILVAPKGIGPRVRSEFVAGSGVLGALAANDQEGWRLARSIAQGLGLDRVGLVETTFEKEAFGDLVSEQAILCGPVPRLIADTVRYLESQGVPRELAWFECVNELKLIVDLTLEYQGVDRMLDRVSPTAAFGGTWMERYMPGMSQLPQKIGSAIRSGEFGAALDAEMKTGFLKTRERIRELKLAGEREPS